MTAYAMASDRARADAGCDGYIAKPIDTRTFVRTVESYLPDRRERLASIRRRHSL